VVFTKKIVFEWFRLSLRYKKTTAVIAGLPVSKIAGDSLKNVVVGGTGLNTGIAGTDPSTEKGQMLSATPVLQALELEIWIIIDSV
jgi:hypothetical protein